MRVALTGATGAVGHWIAAALLAAGHEVAALGRRPAFHAGAAHLPYDLAGPPPPLHGIEALVHAAFSHVPGRYRGGEGDDPKGFLRRNRDGTLRLFEAAGAAGVGRILFLSSRAVYGEPPPGTLLAEDRAPAPDTLYGEVKLEAERALCALAGPARAVASLRATGVYGPPVPGLVHKWREDFDRFARGELLPPRIATEVHAGDLAAAVTLLLAAPAAALAPATFNVSDIVLDRRDLLATYARLAGVTGLLPEPSEPGTVRAMTTGRLAALGWRPRGPAGVEEVVAAMAGGS